jgi:hypothetical protein
VIAHYEGEVIMRRRLVLLGLILILAVISSGVPGVARAQASTQTTISTTLLTNFTYACPDELVFLSGEATVLVHNTRTATGKEISSFTFRLDDVTAVGAESGTVYTVQGVQASGFIGPFFFLDPATAALSRFVETWVLLPEGGGKPLSFQQTFVLVLNPDLELVAFHLTDPECA